MSHKQQPSVIRVIIKDVVDFFIVAAVSCIFTFFIYLMLPNFTHIELSIYFFEQLVEVFFVNHGLIFWILLLSFGVTVIYFLLSCLRHQTTLGGMLARVRIVDKKTLAPL